MFLCNGAGFGANMLAFLSCFHLSSFYATLSLYHPVSAFIGFQLRSKIHTQGSVRHLSTRTFFYTATYYLLSLSLSLLSMFFPNFFLFNRLEQACLA
jgi:hypothetical protein